MFYRAVQSDGFSQFASVRYLKPRAVHTSPQMSAGVGAWVSTRSLVCKEAAEAQPTAGAR